MVIKGKKTGRVAQDNRLKRSTARVQRGTAKLPSQGTVVGNTRYVSRQFD